MLITLLILILSLPHALPMPPRPPVHCVGGTEGCALTNAYGAWSSDRADCMAAAVVYPTSEREVVAAVAGASARNVHVKVVSGFAHTIPRLACPGGGGGVNTSLLISTAKYGGVEVDAAARTVTADAGAALRAVIDAAEAHGLSLPAAPYWEGASVGGVVSTGSHGSSWWGRGGAVHDHVVALRMVVPAGEADGWARLVTLTKGEPLFRAALVSLGLLGVVSKITLALEPRFKRSITYDFRDDGALQDDFADHARGHEFADITWYPSQHKAVYRIDDRVPLNATGAGVNDFIGFQSTLIAVSTEIRALETALEKSRNFKGKCLMAIAEIAAKRLAGNGLRNGVLFTGYPVVGFQGKMQTSGSCLYSSATNKLSTCAWDPRIRGLFFYETTAIFSPTRFRNFVVDVKKLRDMNPDSFCGVDIYNGFLVRFIKKSEAYLGQPEDSVVMDFNYYRAADPSSPRLGQDIWEEVEQLAFVKHGARPHWAKNRMVAFWSVQDKYPGWGEFAMAKQELDPRGLFDSPWSNEVVGGMETRDREDGCALDGRCVCSEDKHCSPGQGYFCQPGHVYREARVCRYYVSQVQ